MMELLSNILKMNIKHKNCFKGKLAEIVNKHSKRRQTTEDVQDEECFGKPAPSKVHEACSPYVFTLTAVVERLHKLTGSNARQFRLLEASMLHWLEESVMPPCPP